MADHYAREKECDITFQLIGIGFSNNSEHLNMGYCAVHRLRVQVM